MKLLLSESDQLVLKNPLKPNLQLSISNKTSFEIESSKNFISVRRTEKGHIKFFCFESQSDIEDYPFKKEDGEEILNFLE